MVSVEVEVQSAVEQHTNIEFAHGQIIGILYQSISHQLEKNLASGVAIFNVFVPFHSIC